MDYMKLKSGTDVRGTAMGDNIDFTPEAAADIAAAFAFWIGKECKIAVGRDSRLTGKLFADAVENRLAQCGCSVYSCGLCSTPSMFMMTTYEGIECDGAIMITASHHPSDKNGMKFFVKDGGLSGSQLAEVLMLACEKKANIGNGEIFYDDYLALYCDVIKRKILNEVPEGLSGFHVVVDAGNGAGGFFATRILSELGADISGSQFLEPDGRFPNHVPNPENKVAMESISDCVIKNKADVGIIFDTDVDRSAIVTADGKEMNRNRLIAVISAILLSEKSGAHIVTDSVTSDGLKEFIESKDGVHIRYKRGYRNVIEFAQKLKAEGKYAPLAIETSGHAALEENYYLDDGAYLAVRLLIKAVQLHKRGESLGDLISELREPVESAEIRLKLIGDNWKELGSRILSDLEIMAKQKFDLSTDSYEGVRANTNDGWFMARMSVHDPIIPFNIESDSVGGVDKIKKILYEFLQPYGVDLSGFITK